MLLMFYHIYQNPYKILIRRHGLNIILYVHIKSISHVIIYLLFNIYLKHIKKKKNIKYRQKPFKYIFPILTFKYIFKTILVRQSRHKID